MNVNFSTERLASDFRNPVGELNSKVELPVSIFEGTDSLIVLYMIAVEVHGHWDRLLKVLGDLDYYILYSYEFDSLLFRKHLINLKFFLN